MWDKGRQCVRPFHLASKEYVILAMTWLFGLSERERERERYRREGIR